MCIERVSGPAGHDAASCKLKPVDVLTIFFIDSMIDLTRVNSKYVE